MRKEKGKPKGKMIWLSLFRESQVWSSEDGETDGSADGGVRARAGLSIQRIDTHPQRKPHRCVSPDRLHGMAETDPHRIAEKQKRERDG